jgi:hypothetical protein
LPLSILPTPVTIKHILPPMIQVTSRAILYYDRRYQTTGRSTTIFHAFEK